MGKLLLGIDIGTYSSKGVLCQPDREIIAQDTDISIPKPGYVEHDPEAVWWAELTTISRELTAQIPPGDHITGFPVSAIGACLLPVDEHGTPLHPAILYGIDTRTVPQTELLE